MEGIMVGAWGTYVHSAKKCRKSEKVNLGFWGSTYEEFHIDQEYEIIFLFRFSLGTLKVL